MPIDNQSSVNWQPIWRQLTPNWRQIDHQLNANQQPILSKSTTNLIHIENQTDANWKPIWCQSTSNLMPINSQSKVNWDISNLTWTNLVSIEVKIIQLAQDQYCKGTPFENFLLDLSTNENPAFWTLDQSEASILALFFCWPHLESPNPMQMCQLTTNCMPIDYKWNHFPLRGGQLSLPLAKN